MPSKTPKFDAALDKILADLTPHTRTCTETGEQFEITAKDIEMLKLLRVPPPTKVWWASLRQMRGFLTGVDLFRRALPDGQSVVSMYDPESAVPIMLPTSWHGDGFDPLAYGREATPDTPFMEVWKALSASVPRPAIVQDAKSVNSEWSVHSEAYKNCYQCSTGSENEDCQYADMGMKDRHCTDITTSHNCEWCYDCLACRKCARTTFSQGCDSCTDVVFSLACKNCTDCFGCTNLRNKKFCFLNEQLTEEEYRKRVAAIDLSDAAVVDEWTTRIHDEVWKKAFRLAGSVLRSENAVGDVIEDCRDVVGLTLFNAERLYHGYGVAGGKDSMNFSSGLNIERCYLTCSTHKAYENKVTLSCTGCMDIEYSELLTNCEHCFGCIGLRNKKFCIFNKQYTEAEYWPLVDAIKTAMLERGEYGEYFAYALSPFAYNTSLAILMFPLDERGAAALGMRWYTFPEDINARAVPASEIPRRLADVTDDILKQKFRSEKTGRAFAFVKPELELHRTLGIALPTEHPSERRIARAQQLFPARLQTRSCDTCGKEVMTRIPASYPAPLYCQECYEQAVIS